MYKFLLIGEGGREAAIAKALYSSGAKIYSYMGFKNPGISRISEKIKIGSLKDFESISEFASKERVDFAICGPEAPLVGGLVNFLEDKAKIPCIGPRKELAMIEGSKSFARELMKKHGIKAYPEFRIAENLKECEEAIDELVDYVIKPDGLTGGKGVKVLGEHFRNKEEALKYCEEVLASHKKVVIERRVEGEEFVLQCFYEGKTLIPMPLVQDHKRAFDDDKGENTGGMGSISFKDHLLPFINMNVFEKSYHILKQTMLALEKETGYKYIGIIYGQFMLTKAGPLIIEYNVRFGDPEAINVLSILKSNFSEICEKIVEGNLSKKDVEFERSSTVCVYFAPLGYPSHPMKDQEVEVQEDEIKKLGVEVYYASLREENGKLYTTGSRSLALLAKAEEITEASKLCYEAAKYVKGNIYYRRDIGTDKLLNKRINNLKKLGII